MDLKVAKQFVNKHLNENAIPWKSSKFLEHKREQEPQNCILTSMWINGKGISNKKNRPAVLLRMPVIHSVAEPRFVAWLPPVKKTGQIRWE